MKYLNQFIYVLEVAKTSSITMAAENLNLTQPALSKYLKKIETELGIELFDRSTAPISLTDAGYRYVEAARRILDANYQLSKQLDQIRNNQNTEINIGISPSRAPYLLPVVMKKFLQTHRSIHVIFDECTTADMNSKLAHGNLDLIINIDGDGTVNFESIDLFDEKILLAIPINQDIAKYNRSASSIELLKTLPLISGGKGQIMWDLLNDVQLEIGCQKAIIECQNMVTAIALVRAGVGAMLVPSYMIGYGHNEKLEDGTVISDGIKFISLPMEDYPTLAPVMQRKVCLYYRKEQFLSRAEKDFIQCVCEAVIGGADGR